MKTTLLNRHGAESTVENIDHDSDGHAFFEVSGVFTVAQLVALAHYLAKNWCPESLSEADNAQTLHEWWHESDQFRVEEE